MMPKPGLKFASIQGAVALLTCASEAFASELLIDLEGIRPMYLQEQPAMQQDNRQYTAVSNIMETKHDTVLNSPSNIR